MDPRHGLRKALREIACQGGDWMALVGVQRTGAVWVATGPEFKTIEMICAMTRKAGDRAALVDLKDIAESCVRQRV